MKEKIEDPFRISWKKDKKFALARILTFIGIVPLFNAIRLLRHDGGGLQLWVSAVLGFGLIFLGSYFMEKTKTYKKTAYYKMAKTMEGKNDPKLTRNLLITEGVVFLLFAGLIGLGAFLQGKGIDNQIKYFDEIFMWSFVAIFASFFFVMAYFGIKKKYFISADYLNYFLMIGIVVLVFQGGINAVLIVGGIIGIVALFVFGRTKKKSKDLKTKEDRDIYARKIGYLFLILGIIVFLFFLGLEVRAAKVFGQGLFANPFFESLGLEVYDPFDSRYPNTFRDIVKSESTQTYTLNGIEYEVKVGKVDNKGAELIINGHDPGFLIPERYTLRLPDGGALFVEKIFYDDYYSKYQVTFWIGNS
ncbi:hypothetical protein HYU50_04455 [Candidatus Woesearchaeota archaeon]|nr:hypothetical protein [Candidatus Woesearchaeota archaeon]